METEYRVEKQNGGFALMVVLVLIVVLVIGSAAFLNMTSSDLRMTRRESEVTRAFWVAQAGTEKAVAQLKTLYAKNRGHTAMELAEIVPPQHQGFTYDEFAVAHDGDSFTGPLMCGWYKGLHGRIQKIRIASAVSSSSFYGVRARISQEVEAQFIPVFQFAIFYNSDDLEILPGKPMTVLGPVHCNHNVYMAAESSGSLSFDSIITSVGDIFHGRKDSDSLMEGVVRMRDAEGAFQEMLNPDGTWLDSEHPDWTLESQNRWDGNVASRAHQVASLRLPLATPEQPRDLIARGTGEESPEIQAMKYFYRADLSIIDGVAYDRYGYSVDLAYYEEGDNGDEVLVNPVSQKEFYNFRESTTVSVTEVDVASLMESGKFPDNGILYVSDQRSGSAKQDAVRLVNGQELPSQGLTVATDRPLYIWGDYNTVNKKPASVVCDAINILSNGWEDQDSQEKLNKRKAKSTEVNVAIIAGNTVTSVGEYNGGAENMPRFLEDWSGRTLTYRGSLVAAWESAIATGPWYYGGDYYTAPNRDWAYDFDLSDPDKSPPGEPSVYTVAVAHWRYEWQDH